MDLGDLTENELQSLAVFALGALAGLLAIAAIYAVLEEWVIAADTADRRRIREVVREMLDAGELSPAEATTAAAAAIRKPRAPLYPEMFGGRTNV